MAVRFVNNFRAPLAASVSSDSTTFSFPSGYGDLFRAKLGSALGSDHVYGTMFNSGGDIEIVKITETSGDIFTVVRSQDNTSPRAWLSGDYISCRPCAAALTEAVSLPTDLARSGVNIDITELRGLTTPLSVAQGGTGVTSLAALVSALGLDIGSDVMGYVAPGTAGNVLTSSGSAWTSAALNINTLVPSQTGNSAKFLTTNGTAVSWAYPQTLVSSTAQATTSGSSKDFTGIPSTAKRVTVLFNEVSAGLPLGSTFRVQIGDSGGVETSGYTNYSDGAVTSFWSVGDRANGITLAVVLTNVGGNVWAMADGFGNAGVKTLSATLDRLRVSTSGTFVSGELNIMYE